MPRIRSLVTNVQIDLVKRAHDCQANDKHKLTKGDLRLAVRKDRGWDNYCLECGKRILERDAAKIASILQAINSGVTVAADEE